VERGRQASLRGQRSHDTEVGHEVSGLYINNLNKLRSNALETLLYGSLFALNLESFLIRIERSRHKSIFLDIR
jgi:hypothetical protein